MLATSVQAVVACNATAPRVCTLVFFISTEFVYHLQMPYKITSYYNYVSDIDVDIIIVDYNIIVMF